MSAPRAGAGASARPGAGSGAGPDAGPGTGVQHARRRLAAGATTAVEHTLECLAAIDRADPQLGAFVTVDREHALRQAEAADAALRRLGPRAWTRQPLLGVTVSVKDLVQTGDLPTTRGSLLPNRRPRVDAPAVARLRAAGAVIIGKTSTSEHGWSASTLSRVAPPARNPWNPALSAGGSSGGAAVSVATGMCDAALGTDGAGSIRIPASFCGIVGFKPSYGLIPYVPAGPDRLSHLGPLTRSVCDADELAALLAGADPRDPDSGAALRHAPGGPAAGRPLRIAWVQPPGVSPEVAEALAGLPAVLAGQGHRVERIPLPFDDPYPALVDLLAAGEAAGTAPEDEPWCDPARLALVRYGRTLSAVQLVRAEDARLALRSRLAELMQRHDLLVMPTVPVEPFDAHQIAPPWAEGPEELRWLAWSPLTYPFNLTGQPALSLPAGLTRSGLPAGVQLVGALGADQLVLSAGRRLERDLGPLPPAPPLPHPASAAISGAASGAPSLPALPAVPAPSARRTPAAAPAYVPAGTADTAGAASPERLV